MRAVMPCGCTSISAPICWSALTWKSTGSAPDAVAADERHERLVGAVEERPEQQDRDAVEAGELERHPRRGLRGGDHRDRAAVDHHLEADRPQDVGGDADVADRRGVGDGRRRVRHEGGDHVLGDGVLGARPPGRRPAAARSARCARPGPAGSAATTGVGASMASRVLPPRRSLTWRRRRGSLSGGRGPIDQSEDRDEQHATPGRRGVRHLLAGPRGLRHRRARRHDGCRHARHRRSRSASPS